MSNPRKQLLLLVPDADKIAIAYGIDQVRAKRIQARFITLFELFGDLITEQDELIEGQAKTARLVDRQARQAQDAGKIRREALRFLSGDPVPVEHVLSMIFSDFWRSEFLKLNSDIKTALFAELSIAIESLDTEDKAKDD